MTIGSLSVAAGASQSIGPVPAGAAIGVSPGSGGSMNVTYRVSPNGPLRTWSPGAVTVDTVISMSVPCVEMHFSATTQNGLAEWNWTDRKYP